jgi:hypothetical protein
MKEIPLHRIGIIKNSFHSKEIGWYITVQDDTKVTGGYKIFTSNNIDFENGYPDPAKTVFDGWVEKKEYIPLYFSEAQYNVDWTQNQIMIEWSADGNGWQWKRS